VLIELLMQFATLDWSGFFSSSRMIWLGDLNYRVSLSYEETRTLLEENDWDTLLEKDQV
jgi:hypothetical protein